jgi:hypothetical protein
MRSAGQRVAKMEIELDRGLISKENIFKICTLEL